MASGVYRAEIDGLRFFAIAIVVAGHFTERAIRFFPEVAAAQDHPLVWILARPGLGVYLFFAISGFILATQAMKAKAGPLSSGFLRAYFGRRVLRIEPPYLILLVLTWAGLMLSGYTPEKSNQFAVAPASLTVSLMSSLVYVHGLFWGSYPRLFPPGWSLEVEVQFYLIAPLLFAALFAWRSRATRLLFGLVLLAAGTVLSLYVPRQVGSLFVFDSILRFFHFFWLGILLADWQGWLAEKTRNAPPVLLACLGWGAFLAYLAIPNAPEHPGNWPDILLALTIRSAALGTVAAMFVGVFGPRSSFRCFCASPWASLIGGACYSIYLTHIQVLQVMTGLIAKIAPNPSPEWLAATACAEIPAVLVVGLAFYALIERTFMIPGWPQKLRAQFATVRP